MNKQYIAISIPFLILNTGEISLIDTRPYSNEHIEFGKTHISGITCAISYYRETPQAARYDFYYRQKRIAINWVNLNWDTKKLWKRIETTTKKYEISHELLKRTYGLNGCFIAVLHTKEWYQILTKRSVDHYDLLISKATLTRSIATAFVMKTIDHNLWLN